VARKLYSTAAAVVAGMIARKAVEKIWSKAVGKAPPQEPESPSVHWLEAIGWSAFSGTTVAIARLLATRKAAGAWERVSADGVAPAGPRADADLGADVTTTPRPGALSRAGS
jgi:hypothetical protein